MASRRGFITAALIGGGLAAAAIVGLAQAQDGRSAPAPGAAAADPVRLRRPEPPARVDWAAAVTQARRSPAAGAATLKAGTPQPLAARLPRAELDRTRLPLLMPRTGGRLRIDQAKIVSFGDAYSLNLPQGQGMQLTLMGNRSTVRADRGAVSRKPRLTFAGLPEEVRVVRLEDGWTASFRRYGVLYTVDLLCDDPQGAPCATDSFLRQALTEMTEVAVGAEALREAQAAGVR